MPKELALMVHGGSSNGWSVQTMTRLLERGEDYQGNLTLDGGATPDCFGCGDEESVITTNVLLH